VLIGLAIIGFLLSFMYLRDAPGHNVVWTLMSAAAASAVSVAVFLLVSTLGNRGGWTRPRVGIVLLALLLASIIRTCVASIFVSVRSGGQVFDSGTLGRALTTLTITLVVGLIVAASVQLADERAQAKSVLLVEQGRLRKLADSADAERRRSEIDLWNKARELLEPTINEIRELIAGEISESAARQISDRIHEVVNEVVRPASRELARSSIIEPRENVIELPSTLRVFEDRMDITRALKPGWLLIVWWGVLIPGMLLASIEVSVMVVWIAVSMLFILPLYGLKVVWPRRLRDMTIARGLGVLLILYAAINVAFQYSVSHFGPVIEGSESWASTSVAGVLLRIALGMLVSVLAMLNVHSEQIRTRLVETNTQLEELISRIRRETWLLHRVVSLAVHGTVQSALISTAMRLSAADRTPETVADARRRLEAALRAISADQSESASLSLALKDLQGLWSPLVRISFEIGLLAEQRLAKDAGLRRCVIEICREAASNAIRHGHAKAIEIQVEATGDLIEVHVTDDGDGIATAAVPGLGSEMLDDTCLRWQLDRSHDEGSELIAVLA
jgi:signal transduction histidine kinase